MTSRLTLKFDVRPYGLGIVNNLPRPIGAFSISTPNGKQNYEKEYNFYEYQERNQSLYCPGGLHHERAGGKAGQAVWRSPSVPNLSDKLRRESLRYKEAVELADALGYNLVWQKRR